MFIKSNFLAMFFDRENIIEIYKSKLDLFKSNKWQNTYHLALLWLRRTWKTTLIKHLLDNFSWKILTIYFDFSSIITTPLNFSQEIIYKLFSKIDGKNYTNLDEIRLNQTDKEVLEMIKKIENILIKWNNFQIIDTIFAIITAISKNHKIIIAFDEFQDLLDFRTFADLKNIDSIFRTHLLEQKNVFYIISGSYPEIIKDLILNPKNKLYSHFETHEIWNFDKENSKKFIKFLNKDLNNDTIKNIYTATNWNPYLISILSVKLNKKTDFEDIIKTELFNNKWQIYNHFLYILETSIAKVWKTSTLNAILKEVAISWNYKISELSKKIWVSSQLISKELEKLKDISILYQDIEKNIKFRDYLFRFFCYYYFSGYEIYEIESSKFYRDKVEELANKLLSVSTELWRAKEFELYFEIKENEWKTWKGIKLPLFKTIEKNYFTKFWDEIDLYCETLKWQERVFELKYKSKQIWNKEIEKFLKKIEADKYVIVSKSGFSEKVNTNLKNVYLVNLEDF